ncbi:MAG: TIGR02186 family protein [Candidatus Midichloria sp.]|nr:TIGR02186 family protein [Candidatus Midichloria sp.]
MRIIVFLLIFLPCKAFAIQNFKISLSSDQIVKSKGFKGTNITLEIKANFPTQFIVEVLGPKSQYRIWQKEKRFGIWTKSKSFITHKVSSYQFMSTDMNSAELERFSKILLIDIFGRRISFINQDQYSPLEMSGAVSALFQIQKNSMYYLTLLNQENLEKNNVIQIPMAQNIMTGDYKVQVYLIAKGDKKIYTKSAEINVSREEFYDRFEQWTRNWPNLYVILSISITFIFGWIVNLILKR